MMSIPLELRTPRLLLRQFTKGDVDDVLAYTQDPEWARYQVGIPPVPLSRKAAEELVSMFSDTLKWEATGILRMFAIVYEGKVIGELCLNYHYEDRQNDRFELAYSLARKHWGKGLTTESARAAMNWAFRTHDFQRMYAWSDPRNIGSWRVMEKLGMKREGILRSHMKWDGTFRDRVYYGILLSEWEAGLT
jgi:[ribosomal protein S5]-alanine N-acetyltransferase